MVWKCPPHLNLLPYHFLSRYMARGQQFAARDQIHSLRCADGHFHTLGKLSAVASPALQLPGLGAIDQYQDALFEGRFHMQLPVDSVACNKDSWLSLRSSCSSVVLFFPVV